MTNSKTKKAKSSEDVNDEKVVQEHTVPKDFDNPKQVDIKKMSTSQKEHVANSYLRDILKM